MSTNYTMNKKIKAKWIKALKSGDYKQGTGQLRDKDNNFCCLGVLCNLYAQDNPEVAKHETDPQKFKDCFSFPPDIVSSDYAGLDYEVESVLAVMNDQQGKSFKQIANWISKNIKGV